MRTRLEKKSRRLKVKLRTRERAQGSAVRPRICVFKSTKHIYAQLINDEAGKTLASASSMDKDVLEQAKTLAEGSKASSKSVHAAKAVGIVLGQKIKAQQIESARFDRNGFAYHGRVKAVAEGAREAGIKF